MIGQNPRLFRSGRHDRPLYERLWKTILAGETWRGEIINRRKDGSLYTEEMSVTPVRDPHGAISHFIAIKQDVTERKRVEEALRESEARYRELVKNATYGIYRTNLERRFLEVNQALVAMLGYSSEEELLSVNLATDVYRDPTVRAQLLAQATDADRADGVEVEWKRKDGSLVLVRLSARSVKDTRGRVAYFEGIAEDVTERRAFEKQLRQVQKFEAIGQLAGGVAHDFNNVIGAIMGWAELGQEQTPADSRLHTHFKKIKEQADRAAGLTRQLLAFARRQLLEPQNIHLNQTIAELLSLLEKVISKDIELKTVLAPNLGMIRADPTQVEQVLMNLCLNARDAMPRGGQLLIETQNVETDEEYCRSHTYAQPGRYVVLSVTDNGVGMDPVTLEHIFEPFFTTKELGKGTGMGLATVYGVVKQHGGFVQVYSEAGRGSTFHVYFPMQSTAPAEEELKGKEKVAAEPVRGGTETILVAEDHDGVREMARLTLESLGYKVILAEDGEKAVAAFEEHRDRIALAVLDVVMPKLGGQEVYARMRAVKPDVAVLFTTGYSNESAALRALAKKGISVLQKPYVPSLLARKVREVLDRAAKFAPGPIPFSRR
jgi:PAS domain S-box-containing protein